MLFLSQIICLARTQSNQQENFKISHSDEFFILSSLNRVSFYFTRAQKDRRFQASSKSLKSQFKRVRNLQLKKIVKYIAKNKVCLLQKKWSKMTKKLNIDLGDELDYQGSKVFQSLASALGLSVDLVNYLRHFQLEIILFCSSSHPLDNIFIFVIYLSLDPLSHIVKLWRA